MQKLERAHISPFAFLATPEFEAEVRADVETGKLDRIDMVGEYGNGGVLAALQRTYRESLR